MRGIKRSQGSPAARRLPVTDSILSLVHQALDLSSFDHCMFWAACTLGYFGFLRSAEFTVPNLASFSPELHLSVADISVDSRLSPSGMRTSGLKHQRPTRSDRAATFTLVWERLLSALSMPCCPTWHCRAISLALYFCSDLANLCLVQL